MKFVSQLLICLSLTLLGTQTVSAEALLKIANAFNIKAVNGTLYSSGFINQDRSLKLNAGLNLIVIEYEEVFDSDYDDSFEIVKSSPFLLKIYLENNQQYQQRFLKPSDVKAAKRYSLNPIFDIITVAGKKQSQQSVKFELDALASDQTSFILEKTKTSSNTTINLSHSNNQNKDPLSQLNNKNIQLTPQTNALKMLDYWWLQASPEERRIFLETHSINQ